MKKSLCLLAWCCFSALSLWAQKPSIIPIPVQENYPQGQYVLPANIGLIAPKDPSFSFALSQLNDKLGRVAGRKISLLAGPTAPNANLVLSLNANIKSNLGSEGYELNVDAKGIRISANSLQGLYYGLQTFYQLLPASIESKQSQALKQIAIPYAQILDHPRFSWRGMMLDVSRHFFSKEEVKNFIDEISAYKYNILHWHLTDDEGWRIEIKGYPNLTKKGAYNVKKLGHFTSFSKPGPDEPRDYGGFYTQEDIKEIVAYAKTRFVEIMPEVDVPGHSMAAVASYPELSCTPEAVNYQVISGEPFIDWSHGHPVALQDNTLCPANEKVYVFLNQVFTEISQLFPFPYIHIGGDECPKNYWEKNPQIQEMMKKENLKTTQEVQAYFTRRLEKMISAKGKKMMGWDEILEGGGLPKTVGVMSWRGISGGIEASKNGHEVIMTPNSNVYIDLMQGDKLIEPPVYRTVRLKDAYAFTPVPDGVDARMVKGGQANLWSEQLFNYRHLQYMTYPRAFAIAEAMWSPSERKDWKQFIPRVEQHFKRFDAAEKKYAPSMYEPIFEFGRSSKGELWAHLSPEIDGVDFHISFDHSFPDKFYPKAEGKVMVPKDATVMKVVSIRNGQMVGRFIDVPVSEMLKRIK